MSWLSFITPLSTMKEKLPSECWMTTDAPLNRWDLVDSCAWGFVCADISCHTHKSALPVLSRHFWLGRILFDDSLSELRAKFQQRSSHQREVHRSRVITPRMSQDELPEILIGGDSNRRRHQKTLTHTQTLVERRERNHWFASMPSWRTDSITKHPNWKKKNDGRKWERAHSPVDSSSASRMREQAPKNQPAVVWKRSVSDSKTNSHNSIFLAALPLRAKHVRRALGPHSCG